MMTDFVAGLSILLMLAGTLACVAAQRQRLVAHPNIKKKLITIGGLLIATSFFLTLAVDNETPAAIAAKQVLFCLAGFLVLFGVYIRFETATAGQKQDTANGAIVTLALALGGFIMFIFYGWCFVGDFLRDRQYVDGVVGERSIKTGRDGFKNYYVKLNGADFKAIFPVYEAAAELKNARAQIGSGSGTIFQLLPITDRFKER